MSETGNPAFLALIGQTRLRDPEMILPQILLALFDATDTAVILDLVNNLQNS